MIKLTMLWRVDKIQSQEASQEELEVVRERWHRLPKEREWHRGSEIGLT